MSDAQVITAAVAYSYVDARMDEFDLLGGALTMPPPGSALGHLVHSLSGDLDRSRLLVQLWGESIVSPEVANAVEESILARIRQSIHGYLVSWAERGRGMEQGSAERFADHYAPLMVGISYGYLVQHALSPDFDGGHYLAMAHEFMPE